MKLLKELLEKDNITSMHGYLKDKLEKSQKKVGELLDAANKAVDVVHPQHSKILTDLAKKEHENIKKYGEKLKAVESKHENVATESIDVPDWLIEHYHEMSKTEREAGGSIQINYNLPTISITTSDGENYFFQGDEASDLLESIPSNVDPEDYLLSKAQIW